MAKISKTLNVSQPPMLNGKFTIPLLILLTVCAISQPAEAETSIYVFDPNQSTVVQTGGFAGVDETYPIEGYFQLSIDIDTGFASFEKIDANMLEPSSFLYTENLGDLFNMTGLSGTIIDETTIEFEGKTADGTESDIRLKLSFNDGSAHLTGNITPPPNSADMFFYDVNALAIRKYASGTGEPNDPYQIATAQDLMLLGETPGDYNKHFILINDIDLDPNLPGRKVFDKAVIAPYTNDMDLKFEGTSFTGTFDGNGHTISHLMITGKSNLGLFGQLKYGAKITNLGLEAVYVNGTGFYAGGLVGENSGGIIVNCYTSGNISGSWYVGGLTGCNSPGTVAYCYSTGTVSGEFWIGGLVGFNESQITNCYAASKILGTINFGGLVGYSESMFSMDGITNSYFLISRDGGGPDNGFGFPLTEEKLTKPDSFFDWDFVGEPDGPHDIWAEPVESGYPILWWQLSPLPALPFLSGKGEPNDPYLISTADELNSIGHNPRLMDAHFRLEDDIDLEGIDFFMIGTEIFPFSGVFDGNGHTISNFNHTSKDFDSVGLFGYVKDSKTEIRNLGLISPNINSDNWQVGSLVGYFEGGTISNCYADGGSVNGYYGVGGLVGSINGTITNCNSSTTVSGTGTVGGLVGYNVGTMTHCYSTSSVHGSEGWSAVGGLMSVNDGTVIQCYSTGAVSGNSSAGGLMSHNYGTVTQCYSTGAVSGSDWVGGLVGFNPGTVIQCYSTGTVFGHSDVGGLIGYNPYNGRVSNCFWDTQTSEQTNSYGGTGLSTTQMKDINTYLDAGWDFVGEIDNGTEDIWWILEGEDYPRLWWELSD